MKINEILNELEIEHTAINQDLTIPASALPKQRVDGKILTKAGRHRCSVFYETIENQGRYGIIQACKRVEGYQTRPAVVKRPRCPSLSLAPEAVLQSLCYYCMEKHGAHGAISKPYDLFIFANEVRFTMEYIEGMNFKKFIDTHGESEIINCIIQLAYILHVLGEELSFDHRDLRIENIWIRPLSAPRSYRIKLNSMEILEFKFQVVLLDFGFACLGSKARKAIVNLGEGVFPQIDPCPKTGRDMYQFLNSCFENKIQDRLSSHSVNLFKEWMKPYTIIPATLTYATTYDPKFELKSLDPVELLKWYFYII